MAAKRIYKVLNGKDSSITLVDASSGSQAVGYVVRGQYSAKAATTREVAELVGAGKKIEVAGEEPEST